MNKDSLFQIIQTGKDTLKALATNTKPVIETEDFDYTKTFLTALIGALIAQIIIGCITWFKSRKTLKEKKHLVKDDLSNQLIILQRLESKLNELNEKFECRETNSHTSDSFHDLQTDIYESVSKQDLHKIFKKDIFLLVDIYKSIRFLQENSVSNIYGTYIIRLENHIKEKEADPTHDFFCITHIHFIESAQSQIRNNIIAISDVKGNINKILGT